MANLINGRSYSYSQIKVIMLNGLVFDISTINYTTEQEKTNNFGVGEDPVSRGKGAKDTSASIELSMNEVEAIRDSIPGGSLLDLDPFDIQVTFLNAQKVVTHIIKNCEFTTDGNEMTQGDTNIKRLYDLVPSHIKYR